VLVTHGAHCETHAREKANRYDASRRHEDWRQLYHEARWRRERARWLRKQAHLLCIYCLAEGRTTPANSIDHDPPHDGDRVKFYDRSTWRPSCVSCNARRARRSMREMARVRGGRVKTLGWERLGDPASPDLCVSPISKVSGD
jgi:5-methylcytosine-specific restriction protein A